MKMPHAIAVLSAILLTGCVKSSGAFSGENLLLAVPGEYTRVHSQTSALGESIEEFAPQGSTVENWSDMLTVQMLSPVNDTEKFYSTMDALLKKHCRGGSTAVVATSVENGYPIKFFQLTCPLNRNTGMGEITFVKTIKGKDKFYVIQKAWRTAPFDSEKMPLAAQDITAWGRFMGSVAVCDTRNNDNKCP